MDAAGTAAGEEEYGARNIPPVVKEACCRRTESPANLKMSTGMRECWAAKIRFISGMYWLARSPDVLMMRIRDVSATLSPGFACAAEASALAAAAAAAAAEEVKEIVVLLMYESASVRAPAMRVVLVAAISSGVVVSSRFRKLERTSSSTRRKGRYLFASLDEMAELPLLAPFEVVEEDVGGVGYSHAVRWQ